MNMTTPLTTGPDGLFEIQNPAVDLEAVVQIIETNLKAHEALFADAPVMPRFELGDRPSTDSAAANLSDLLYHLHSAERDRDQIGAEKELGPSWATQVPLIGKWWGQVRGELHNLILFYVNKAAGRQAGFNESAVGVLRYVAEQAEEVERLKAQIALLEDRLAALEAQE